MEQGKKRVRQINDVDEKSDVESNKKLIIVKKNAHGILLSGNKSEAEKDAKSNQNALTLSIALFPPFLAHFGIDLARLTVLVIAIRLVVNCWPIIRFIGDC